MVVVAKLIKLKLDNGLMEMADHIELGREYQVDLSTIQMRKLYHFQSGKEWQCEMVQDTKGGWLPTEMLQW